MEKKDYFKIDALIKGQHIECGFDIPDIEGEDYFVLLGARLARCFKAFSDEVEKIEKI